MYSDGEGKESFNKYEGKQSLNKDEGEKKLSEGEGYDSEDLDGNPDDLKPTDNKSKINPSQKHEYSEIDDGEDEVFELPSNSESFKAGTIFRSSSRWVHDKPSEAELAQIIFRAKLLIKQHELDKNQRNKE